MYPVRSRIVRTNPFFLGEQLPSASELMATDPGVSSLQSALESAKARWNNWLSRNFSWDVRTSCGKQRFTVQAKASGKQLYDGGKWTGTGRYNRKGRGCGGSRPSKAPSHILSEGKAAKRRLDDLQKRIKNAEKRVWDRISKSVPYKGHVIHPIIDRSKNQITYQVKKGGENVGVPHQRLDEAKASIDDRIAQRQQKEVDQWSEDRLEAERKAAATPAVATQPSPAQPEEKGNLGKILLIGGAAAGALLLMR